MAPTNGGTLVVDERWVGPEEQWPRHPKAYWRGLLKEARQAGWHLTVYSDHGWGRLVCDREVRNPCTVRINSTAANGEFFVLHSATPRVRGCKHRAVPAILAATRLLERAERLLDAVEECLDARVDRRRATDLLDAAARGVADADTLFEDAVRLEGEAEDREAAARSRIEDEGLTRDAPLDAVVAEAQREVRGARAQTQRPPAGVRRRIEEARARVAGLRARID